MSTLSVHLSPSAVARSSRRRGWLARFFALVQESRMRTARAEIARHRHLLPAEFELAGDRLDARSEHQLPSMRAGAHASAWMTKRERPGPAVRGAVARVMRAGRFSTGRTSILRPGRNRAAPRRR